MILETLLALTLLGTAPATALDTMIPAVERGVVVGSVDSLERARGELLEQLTGDAAPSVDQRYLLAYIDWRLAQLMMAAPKSQEKERLEILEEAQQHLEALIEAAPEHAEGHALLGSILGLQIGDSAFRGMRLGPRSSAAIDRAHELAPENPRVALARGIGWLHTPKAFGGGVDKAAAELRRAEELFQQESPDKAWPYWGHVDSLIWHGQAHARLKNPDTARILYQRALAIEPDYGWIRYRLLPALDASK
ncbi:MAG: hypothetical protein AAF657_39525 [Acidobacteriota bacterium]